MAGKLHCYGKSNQGFTLVELVVVLLLLGILAATALPRFVNLQGNAEEAALKGVVGSLRSGVHQARAAWKLGANGQPAENLQVFGTTQSGQLDFNANGWPSQQWFGGLEANPILNNVADCISVVNGILQGTVVISNAPDADYSATYLGSNSCRYTNTQSSTYSFTYNSNTGDVLID